MEFQKDNNELRKKIKEIKNNISLSEFDKNIAIQNLMNRNNNSSLESHNCTHYPNKKCNNFLFSCCNKKYNCMRCHNENETHKPVIEKIICNECNVSQNTSNKCINCSITFSKSYCELCFIWSEHEITHCNNCGFCRVGKENTLFHCTKCETCFNIENKNNHICVKNSFRLNICAYCLDSNHSSQETSVILKCEHIVHNKCLEKAIETNDYKCPTCRKSICKINWTFLKNLILSQPMPLEELNVDDIVKCNTFGNMLFQVKRIIHLNNDILCNGFFINWIINNKNVEATIDIFDLKKEPKKITIYCNDCDEKCITNFHYLGNECITCNGFNTSI